MSHPVNLFEPIFQKRLKDCGQENKKRKSSGKAKQDRRLSQDRPLAVYSDGHMQACLPSRNGLHKGL